MDKALGLWTFKRTDFQSNGGIALLRSIWANYLLVYISIIYIYADIFQLSTDIFQLWAIKDLGRWKKEQTCRNSKHYSIHTLMWPMAYLALKFLFKRICFREVQMSLHCCYCYNAVRRKTSLTVKGLQYGIMVKNIYIFSYNCRTTVKKHFFFFFFIPGNYFVLLLSL